jgi:hypothetical protein
VTTTSHLNSGSSLLTDLSFILVRLSSHEARVIFLAVLGFELRASLLLGTRATPPAIHCLVIFQIGSQTFCLGGLSREDDRHEPLPQLPGQSFKTVKSNHPTSLLNTSGSHSFWDEDLRPSQAHKALRFGPLPVPASSEVTVPPGCALAHSAFFVPRFPTLSLCQSAHLKALVLTILSAKHVPRPPDLCGLFANQVSA